jgi:LysR family glycine cleavage system transcriptional activator
MTFQDDPTAFPEDPGLSWSQLRAFIACVRYRSFNAAAAAVGLTSSAVRYQIGLLEHRLGRLLFERRGGTLALTDVGQSFAQRVEAPMRDLVAACAEVATSADDGPMTLTVPPLFARQFLFDPHLIKWCDANRIDLDITDVKRDLFAQPPVAAVRLAAEDHTDLSLTKLLKVSAIIAAAPAIANHARPIDRAWWAEQMLIHTTISDTGWLCVWSALGLAPTAPKRTHVFSSHAAALEAAASGYGIILAPLPFAQLELSSGRLKQISNVRLAGKYDFSLVMRRSAASSARGRALRQKVVSAVAAQAGSKR